LERLDAGEVVVGDGGFLFCMEKRGYVKAGVWTPEATVEHPEAGNGIFITLNGDGTRKAHFEYAVAK